MKNNIKADYNKVFSNYQRLIKNTEFDADMLKVLGRSQFKKYNFFQVTKPKKPTSKDIKALEKKLEMLKEVKKQRRELEGIKERIRKREEDWVKKNKPKQPPEAPPEPPQKPPRKPPEDWRDDVLPGEDEVIRNNLIDRIDSIIEYITGGMQLENPRRSRYFNGNTDDLKMYMSDTINSLYDFRELVDEITSETVELFAEEYEREMVDTIIEREVYWDKICDAAVEWVRMCRSLMNSSLKATTEEEAIKALEDEYGDFL